MAQALDDGKEREEDKKVQGVEVKSDLDTSSNMFPSQHKQTLSCHSLQKIWAPYLIHIS